MLTAAETLPSPPPPPLPVGATAHVAAELAAIGLTMIPDDEAQGFLPGIRIDQGALRYAPHALPSNLLHEAGHLAICPESLRHHASGNLSGLWRALGAQFEAWQTGNPDDPFIRACLQCSDPEATAWAYAFGTHIGMSPEEIILDDQYDGAGDAIRLGLQMNAYIGINGLRAAGFLRSVKAYPALDRWLQNGI